MEMPQKHKRLFARGQFLAMVVNLPMIVLLPLYCELYLKPAELTLKYILAYVLDGMLTGNFLLVMSLFQKVVTSITYIVKEDTLEMRKLSYLGRDKV